MADLQSHLELFHNRIRVSTEPLTEKRDIILDIIRNYLRENSLPGFELINQGSYIYGVGVKPLGENEYDIDVGLAFNITTKDYPDASIVRKWVLAAIDGHTNKVLDRKPCIRVHYAQGFHVDLVIYAKYKDSDETDNFQLGYKDGSWKDADPKKLKEYVNNAKDQFKETKVDGEANQLQRVVRYFKRWNDILNPVEDEDKPTGISLLLLAIKDLSPTLKDDQSEPDDLYAMISFLEKVIPVFSFQRIIVNKPTPQYEDVFARISATGMSELLDRLKTLKNKLIKARETDDVTIACSELRTIFGDDFPKSEKVTKAEVADSVRLDSTYVPTSVKLEALKRVASQTPVSTKPWFQDPNGRF